MHSNRTDYSPFVILNYSVYPLIIQQSASVFFFYNHTIFRYRSFPLCHSLSNRFRFASLCIAHLFLAAVEACSCVRAFLFPVTIPPFAERQRGQSNIVLHLGHDVFSSFISVICASACALSTIFLLPGWTGIQQTLASVAGLDAQKQTLTIIFIEKRGCDAGLDGLPYRESL